MAFKMFIDLSMSMHMGNALHFNGKKSLKIPKG